MDDSNTKYELQITKDKVYSTDRHFTIEDLSLGDTYKFFDAYFESSNGEIIRRIQNKFERKKSNQVLPRLACQIYEKHLLKLSKEEREKFPICQYNPTSDMIQGLFSSIDDFKGNRNSREYLKYECNNGENFVFYCWNVFSTLMFVHECLKRFGKDGDKFILVYTEKEGKKKPMEINSATLHLDGHISIFSKLVLSAKNVVFRGAPGTGKTYLSKQIAANIVSNGRTNDINALSQDEINQIDFVQFHPSYDYTDFVEGLRPISNGDGAIEFKLQDGIFKQFCQKAKATQKTGGQDNFDEAWDRYLEYVNSRDEKEYLTEFSYLTVNSRNNFNINYETKAQGTVLTKFYVYELYKDENYLKQPYYRNQGKKVLEILKKRFGLKDYISPTEIKTDKNFVFIIDEINRGEISKIFGELFFSIDPGYRGEKGSVSTQYANLHETDEKFYIPDNVYIIGTMNDIDRSVDTFDFAMRRRFRFVEVTAESQLYILDEELGEDAKEAKIRLRNLNAAIENVQELNSHYHIGPSYFLRLKEVKFDYELLWSDYLQPLLEDYVRGSYDEAETLETLKKAFYLTKNKQKNQAVADDNESDENDDADNR